MHFKRAFIQGANRCKVCTVDVIALCKLQRMELQVQLEFESSSLSTSRCSVGMQDQTNVLYFAIY